MASLLNWNGKIVAQEQVSISPNNRSFKYGDGCFETMKLLNGKLLLQHLHFQRLFSSLSTLQFSIPSFFTPHYLLTQILELVKINQHTESARVRLMVYRGNGGLYDLTDLTPNFIIESVEGSLSSNTFNDEGLVVDFFPDAKKAADRFSSIKSNNYLGYVMGAIWAKQHNLDDCILFNASGRVVESTIANVFTIDNGVIKTPALSEGCISGVMRAHLINSFLSEKIPFVEGELTKEEVLNASEVFFTNATYGIRWVQQIGNSNYGNFVSSFLHKKFITPLFGAETI